MTRTKPTGSALGADQADAIVSEVRLHLDLMRRFAHRRDHPPNALKRTEEKSAHRVQCDFHVVWHAGRALELALHGIYAVANNRIRGREAPGIPDEQVAAERREGHSVRTIYHRLIENVDNSDAVVATLEDCYQSALHEGATDVYVNGDKVGSEYTTRADSPFLMDSVQQIVAGREATQDYAIGHFFTYSDVITNRFETLSADVRKRIGDAISKFWKMSGATFSEFLAKADKAYYGEKGMRYADYWWRDHEDFRPYIRVGWRFFDRLIRKLVELCQSYWIMEESYFKRQMARLSDYNREYGRQMIKDWSDEAHDVALPKKREDMEHLRRPLYRDPEEYDYTILHTKRHISTDH